MFHTNWFQKQSMFYIIQIVLNSSTDTNNLFPTDTKKLFFSSDRWKNMTPIL
jgi:hypothetical protein